MITQGPKPIAAAILAAGMIFLGCTSRTIMGPGSETVAVVGRVVDSLGQPASKMLVMLMPALYNPLTDPPIADSMLGITNEAGHYAVKAPGPGVYSLEAVDITSNRKGLVTGITTAVSDTVSAPQSVLRATGALRVELQDTVNQSSGYVYLPGTSCFAVAQNGTALVEAVPADVIPAVCYANTAAPTRNHVIQTNLAVASNDTQVIADITPWKYSKRLYLNTSLGGANVGHDVYNFPVLLRLTTSNFDFSQTNSDGGDVRFTKSNGAPLPYEIERWDPTAGLAEVWVRVDTVFGSDSTHAITMYWGISASSAASISNGQAVFDTASGFQGVWHLAEAGGAIAKDATGNHYDGTPSDTAPSGADGVIGPCRSFNGSSNFLRMNGTAMSKLNFPQNGIYTISAWAYAGAIDYGAHLIVGKSNEQYAMKFKFSLQNSPMVWELSVYRDSLDWCSTNSLPVYPSAKTWTYITGVRNGTVQYFYLNGEQVDSSISVSSGSIPAAEDVTIGRFLSKPPDSIEGICPFNGMIDEVRISNTANSADWIKLCYMNQKMPDALVKW